MALPMLVGGADCGPSNPLQNLSKQLDRDRGIQQDYFRNARAGSSNEAFRSQPGRTSQFDQDAVQFFSKSPETQTLNSSTYDLRSLRSALTTPAAHAQQQPLPVAGWATDFLLQQPLSSSSQSQLNPNVEHVTSTPIDAQGVRTLQPLGSPIPFNSLSRWGMGKMAPNFAAHAPPPPIQALVKNQHDQVSWDTEFDTQQALSILTAPSTALEESAVQQSGHDTDELARTAGLLLESVKNEQNPKFQKSQFLGLMTQLRDHKVVVKGNQMVENDETVSPTGSRADIKGKGRAVESFFSTSNRLGSTEIHDTAMMQLGGYPMMDSQHYDEAREQSGIQEDANDAYFKRENADFTRYWNEMNAQRTHSSRSSFREMESSWARLQDDWDHFEASEQSIHPVVTYQFQQDNPYLRGQGHTRTRHHSLHLDERLDTVLELEAAVQRNMNDASAWFELGVKQQENEREQKALQALQRAVELDPSHLPSWLALAVSHTNDGHRIGTYEAIREWVMHNDVHRAVVQQYLAHYPETEGGSAQEKLNHLVQCLITMAQQHAVDEIEADIQIALAVLFNTIEDYTKAQDCFRAALSVRPDDWLLYNRVGATMANSGHADEALQYYYRALELNPLYIRARYNLGISCINLRKYEEGAQHILDALALQDADGIRDSAGLNEARGITSSTLWDSLKTASLHMQRVDLAALCDRRDLEAFRLNFQM